MRLLTTSFFNKEATTLAQALLGKVLCVKHNKQWLYAQIIETEAYYLNEKGSHSSLGYTEKRRALFMPAGTIYMYYARGGDSLNISAKGEGNAVLIKSAMPYGDNRTMLATMQKLNPQKNSTVPREKKKICAGQTLLCKALGLKVTEWDAKQFDPERFYIATINYKPQAIIQTTRLGIPAGRDEHLQYRFIDQAFCHQCTSNPLKKHHFFAGEHYNIVLP